MIHLNTTTRNHSFFSRDGYEDITLRMDVNEQRARQRMNQRMVNDEHLTIGHEAIVMLFHQNHTLHQAVPKIADKVLEMQ